MSSTSWAVWSLVVPGALIVLSALLWPRGKSVRGILLCLILALLSDVVGAIAELMNVPNGRGSPVALLRHVLMAGAVGALAWHWYVTTRAVPRDVR